MKQDIEIAQEAKIRPVVEIERILGIPEEELELYGKFKAKIPLHFIDEIFLLATFKTIMVKRRLKNMSKKCCFVSFALLIFSFAAVEAQTMFDRRFQPGYVFGIKAGVNVANQFSPGSEGVFDVKNIIGINAGGYNYQSYNNYFQFTAGYRFEREMKLQSKSKTSIRRKR